MSPVVGMILVLAISVVGIAAILYWGLPAIDEMKANVEFRAAESQFNELDATLRELVAGTTEKTAKRWQPSLSRGQVSVYNNTEPWLFAVETYNASADHDLVWGGLTDGDGNFTILSKGAMTFVKVEAYIVTGTSTSTTLYVNLQGSGSSQQMTALSVPVWAANTEKTFSVYSTNSSLTYQRLENATFRFKVYSGASLLSEAWYASTGRIDFNLNAGLGDKVVVENNGAVITGSGGSYAVSNTPPVPPPSNTSGVHRVFARSILLGGNYSFVGADTFDTLITLYATATLGNYDCGRADRSDCVESAKITNFGTYQAPWYAYLTNTNRGYDYTEKTATVAGATVRYLEDREGYMGFTLLQSSIRLAGT